MFPTSVCTIKLLGFKELRNIIYLVSLSFILVNCSKPEQLKDLPLEESSSPENKIYTFFELLKINKDLENKVSYQTRDKEPTAIVLHSTDKYTLKDYIENSIRDRFFFHLLIDKSGNILKYPDYKSKIFRLIPKMDKYSIHVSLEGTEEEILNNPQQLKKAMNVIGNFSRKFSIPLNNKDISSEKGVFTHTQAKKKYGNFVDMRDCGGEKVLSTILTGLSGNYYIEPDWKDRFSKEWTFRKEDPKSSRPKEEFTHGRGITKTPISTLENIEKDSSGSIPEEYRVRYTFDQKMDPTCIVLHYTAISDFKISLKVLEDRRVSANIMVDKNGKAYQLLDSLNHTARAAGGTNHSCIQIEIIGKNTGELLGNEVQTQKVIALVIELSKLYNIPITNEKIESLVGVFSHTQAKKKFGRSVALIGKDFDPGEEYMKKVIEATGSKYYSEEEWYGRTGEDWIILYGDFQP
jgi:N-acetylmuramoyl-L-alanine amidase